MMTSQSSIMLSRCNSIASDDSYESLASFYPETPASAALSPMQKTIAPGLLRIQNGMISDYLQDSMPENDDMVSFFEHDSRPHCYSSCMPHYTSDILKEDRDEGFVPSELASPTSSMCQSESGMTELPQSSYWLLANSLPSMKPEGTAVASPQLHSQTAATTAAMMAFTLNTSPKDEQGISPVYFGGEMNKGEHPGAKRLERVAIKQQRRRAASYTRKTPSETDNSRLPIIVNEMEKQHSCHFEGCTSRFKRQEHLRRHEKTHTGERPHICSVSDCKRQFSRSDNLNAHMKTHARRGGRNQYIEGLRIPAVKKLKRMLMHTSL